MSQATSIGWTDVSWNPVHGCSKVSPGCAHCYAETLSRRYDHTPAPWTPENAAENVILKPHKLREPLSNAKHWRGLGAAAAAAGKTEGKLVFVNSMSDLFHDLIPTEYIARVFNIMGTAQQHTFQVLTKRPKHMRRIVSAYYETLGIEPYPNVWLGVSIENRRFVDRADVLRDTPAVVRFISAEPLLGPLLPREHRARREGPGDWRHDWGDIGLLREEGLDLSGIDWLIVGGESGLEHRPMDPTWARDLRDACDPGGHWKPTTAFFFKQWGGNRPDSNGRELDGREWSEFPQPAGVPA